MPIHPTAQSVHIFLTVNHCISAKVSFHLQMDSAEMHSQHAADFVTGSCPIHPTHPQDNANEFSELTGKMTLFPFPVQPLTHFYSWTGCIQGDVKNTATASQQIDTGENYLAENTLQDIPEPHLAMEAFQAWTKCHERNDIFLRLQAAWNNRLRPVTSSSPMESPPAGSWISINSVTSRVSAVPAEIGGIPSSPGLHQWEKGQEQERQPQPESRHVFALGVAVIVAFSHEEILLGGKGHWVEAEDFAIDTGRRSAWDSRDNTLAFHPERGPRAGREKDPLPWWKLLALCTPVAGHAWAFDFSEMCTLKWHLNQNNYVFLTCFEVGKAGRGLQATQTFTNTMVFQLCVEHSNKCLLVSYDWEKKQLKKNN